MVANLSALAPACHPERSGIGILSMNSSIIGWKPMPYADFQCAAAGTAALQCLA